MSDSRQSTIIKVFRKFSNSLGPDALALVEKILDESGIEGAELESSLETLAKEYNKQDDAIMKVSVDVLKRVYEALQDQGERTQIEKELIDPEKHLFFVDAFDMPRWTWSSERGTFEKSSIPCTWSGAPESRVTSIRDRLNIIRQCVLRNEHFAPSTLPSRDREKLVTLKSTKQLLGRFRERFLLLGMLAYNKEGKLCLEDADGVVELDFSTLDEPGDGLFTEGCFALVEGEYTQEATLEIVAIGQPPCEPRSTARSIYGHIDFLGKGATSLLEDAQFEVRIREELPELHFFFLSDVWLDSPQTLAGIQRMLDNCIENDFIPRVIVMCGNFTSKSIAHGNGRDVQRYQDNFDALADLIASYPLVTRLTHFVFVPGPLDITINSTLPRKPLLSTLTGRLKTRIPKVHFGTNPCRIKFFNQEIVVFREDLLARMLRNVVGVKPDVKSEDLKRFLVQSILDQSHLCPLIGNIQPVLPDYDHGLRLYPLPTALVLADKYDAYRVTYTGCHVFNPGSFVGKSLVFSTYTPAEVNSEECILNLDNLRQATYVIIGKLEPSDVQAGPADMFFWDLYRHLGVLVDYLRFIFLGSSKGGVLSFLLVWFVRIVTFGLLLRTYFIPWLLTLMSNRLRVRSISLRSIRGLRFRKGVQTWKVERVSYRWLSVEGSRRLAVKIEGLTLDIAKESCNGTNSAKKPRNRNLTLADLDPSPIARLLLRVFWAVTIFTEPYFRPLLRTSLIACLRLAIKWLPKLTQALSFDLPSSAVTFEEIPGTKLSAENISLHLALTLTQVAQVPVPDDVEPVLSSQEASVIQNFGLWKKRLAEGFQRSVDTALREIHGRVDLSLKVSNLAGATPHATQDASSVSFLSSPGTSDLGVTASFNPKESLIDTHGLSVKLKISDCNLKVDLLNRILDKVFPKRSSAPLSTDAVSATVSPRETRHFSRFSLTSPASNIASPVYSFTSSIFSPSSLFSPSGPSDVASPKRPILSPTSMLLSPRSPISASSPFFKVLSASMRPRRRRQLVQPTAKLKGVKDMSKLSMLRQFNVSVLSVSLSFSAPSDFGSGAYRALIKQISIAASLSDRSKNALHREHLGSREGQDSFESDAYGLAISLRQITLERDSLLQTMRLVRLGRIELQTLIYQWPSPFLNPSPFLRSDANAALLAIHIKLDNVHVSDRINELNGLLTLLMSRQKHKASNHPSLAASTIPLPRLAVAIQSGPMVARIIYDSDHGEKHRAIEMRSSGMTLTLKAEYRHPTAAITRSFPAASSIQSMHWMSSIMFNLEPILVRVRSKHDFIGMDDPTLMISDPDFLDDPPVLSIGNVEVALLANAIAQIDGVAEAVAVIDRASIAADLTVTFETICVELWHPIAVDATLRLISIIPSKPLQVDDSEVVTRPRFLNLPIGISAKMAFDRLVVFITAPDINPNDSVDLSRGFSVRTTFAIEYCSLKTNHVHWFDHPYRTRNRAGLELIPEALAESVTKAKIPSSDTPALIKILLSNFVFKEAVATQFEPDEPAIVGREDSSQTTRDIVRINTIQINVSLISMASVNGSQYTDLADIVIYVPSIRINFHLAYAYSVLLAMQTLRVLNPARPPSAAPSHSKHPIMLTVNATVKVIQGFITLPTEKLRLRMDGLRLLTNGGAMPKMKWDKVVCLVSPRPNGRDVFTDKDNWNQFIVLQSWEVSFTPLAGSLCVAIDGESAMLHIPHEFVLAQLVQDVAISLKAIRHIARMGIAGCYSEIPRPESEGPKSVPHVTIRLGCLCTEAEDDPFESELGLIWQIGEGAVKQRLEREEAFKAKVAAIVAVRPELLNGVDVPLANAEHDYAFDAKHTVSIEEARQRLDAVHALDWSLRLKKAREKQAKAEQLISQELRVVPVTQGEDPAPSHRSKPPLLRLLCKNLCLIISPPSFDVEQLSDNLHNFGKGLPRDTDFSLLVPLHIHFTLSSLRATLRDYPLPLLFIPAQSKPQATSITFDTDLIIAEEMGTEKSVEWIECPIIDAYHALHGGNLFSLSVPKTIMPVKTYAAPVVHISSPNHTILSWAVSYMPAIQDVMRVVDTITTPSRDPSPAVGFWDKIRLVLHWTVRVTFAGEVCLYMKGTRDPYKLDGAGAGFVLCWQGGPEIRIGHENHQRELIQVMSNEMLIAVPKTGNFSNLIQGSKSLKKVFARLSSGVRFGLGFLFERSCGPECLFCSGSAFHRKCRYFSFRPHYEIKLEIKDKKPELKTSEDSFNEFRSDFIHLSVSLTSSTESKDSKSRPRPSNLYLTPKLFAHFWSWCSLFEGALSLPIRQGSYFPSRPISPKFGRHLATLKYRISLSHLYIMHGYMDDSRETWVDGVVPWVGVKGKFDEFQADMHQRDEESTIPGLIPDTTRTIRRKPIYAAEVIVKGLDLRALLAIFEEPLKRTVGMTAPPERSNYRQHHNLHAVSSQSLWHDLDDFVELDWVPKNSPTLHLLPAASCPHFTYFKQNSALSMNHPQTSKFGSEHSHPCLLGQEPSVTQTQISLASRRLADLKKKFNSGKMDNNSKLTDQKALSRMVTLLESHISQLRDIDSAHVPLDEAYHLPADNVSPQEWTEFEHVYQIHFPSVFLDKVVRDVMMQYYNCSRDRRSLEYHMATRAVKFIKEQANLALEAENLQGTGKDHGPTSTALMAASVIRKMLKGDGNAKISVDVNRASSENPDPMDGWSEGVSLTKSHYCLLMKPQIVLRGESPTEACIVAAAQAKLQSFAIMDLANFDDPASGKVMSRNYTSLSGFQAFGPTGVVQISRDGSIPLEVLIDHRCESTAFERLVPETTATFHYDKFNRLRLHNNMAANRTKANGRGSIDSIDSHLQDETDLIRVHIPRFTVSADENHFQAISTIVTKLLLFSDSAHKIKSDQVQTMLFTYDFTDLHSATVVVTNLQTRLRDAMETELRTSRVAENQETQQRLQQLKAHIFLLSEELDLLFEAIKLAQDRFEDQTDRKSALLLHASSREISWKMIDEGAKLLSKLVVSNINFHWLSRQDSSTVSHLTIGNMSAVDGSRNAIWSEILSKYNEPANHSLLKRGLFLTADWTILPPVGGISIYEAFELNLHPLKLQIDAKVGQLIMEYVWPSRKNRRGSAGHKPEKEVLPVAPVEIKVKSPTGRSSIDSPRALYSPSALDFHERATLSPPHRKLGNSRSYTDLRSAKDGNAVTVPRSITLLPFPKRTNSSELVASLDLPPTPGPSTPGPAAFLDLDPSGENAQYDGDAQVMKSRSIQKTFVLVRIASIHILLSMVKEGSFECHEARIKTKELEYRNQTWSFEELVGQFIPSNMNWRGWVKMAFNQPLLPVLPVARELISKTKWMSSRATHSSQDNALQFLHPRFFALDGQQSNAAAAEELKRLDTSDLQSSSSRHALISSSPLTAEPESMESEETEERTTRQRVKSLFRRKTRSKSRLR